MKCYDFTCTDKKLSPNKLFTTVTFYTFEAHFFFIFFNRGQYHITHIPFKAQEVRIAKLFITINVKKGSLVDGVGCKRWWYDSMPSYRSCSRRWWPLCSLSVHRDGKGMTFVTVVRPFCARETEWFSEG
jgi:hypothetical protein